MKKQFICAAVATATMVSAVVFGSPGIVNQADVTAEEYAVYSAVIGDMFAGGKVTFDTQTKVKLVVIKDHTVRDSFREDVNEKEWNYLKQQLPSVSQETIYDYVAKNNEIYQLSDLFT
ncbi:MAG: hypothetical protein M3R69_01695 [Acidobacteriota bacterium]|nr:hypothetical protein [Acidobacteriota bacterium]